ncbi:uncharacterized protein LOC115692112 [Syzygium oleosum]|uniref:uncharacterized protein LOC115692112 n=1 Tax=Syzygium oleosum TaxID=219896 RepID=UPI0024BAFE80|nr:uncharacterized protein LOC115692112 [Syzygium oleosum]
MERNFERGTMNQQKGHEQFRYPNIDPRNPGLGSTNQSFFHDPSSTINTNMRPPDYNMSAVARPVLNYSIQTGEEFALEFMLNPRQQLIPPAQRDPSSTSGYMDLKGILGISHTGSESGSDISMINSVEKGFVPEFERKSSLANEERNYHESLRSVPRSTSRGSSSRLIDSSLSGSGDCTSARVKFLCSFGGTILPRPSDGKLRYVGGETRIVRISKDITWQELTQKTLAIYNQPHTIKYQLPGEELDALVSVSCDEDLQNMMEECNVLEDRGTQKPRMFLFSDTDLEDAQFGIGSIDRDSEVQYVVAVNGMDSGSRRNSIALGSASGNNLDELVNLNLEREDSRVAGTTADPFRVDAPTSSAQSSQVVPTSSASNYESNLHSYQRQRVNHGEASQHALSAPHHAESFSDLEGKGTISSSVQFLHGQGSTSNFVPHVDNVNAIPPTVNPVATGALNEEHLVSGQRAQDIEAPIRDIKLKRDSSAKKTNGPDKVQPLEKENKFEELKMKREGSMQKIDETQNDNIFSSKSNEGPVTSYTHREDASGAKLAPELKSPLPKAVGKRPQETVQSSMDPEDARDGKKNHEDDPFYASGGAFMGNGGSEADPTELGYVEPPSMPQRVFHSERIPREQAELNRLSKSDDSFGSQFLITQARSDYSQSTPETTEKLHDGDMASQTEHFVSYDKVAYKNPQNIHDGAKQLPRHVESASSDNFTLDRRIAEEVLEPVPRKTESRPLNSADDHGMTQDKEKYKEMIVGAKDAAGPHHQTSGRVAPGMHADNSSLRSSEYLWDEVTPSKTSGKTTGHAPPLAQTVEPSVSVSNPEHGDILIDINDRFPRDFLSDLFSVARRSENLSDVNPLHCDGAGLSLNMENHEPKHWSYFRILAQDEFVRKDVSLMDQDHLGFSAPLAEIEGRAPIDYSYPPVKADEVHVGCMEPRLNYEEDIAQVSSGIISPSVRDVHQDYSTSHPKGTESILDVVHPTIPEMEYEDEKSEAPNIVQSIADLSLGDLDISSLQIIKNEDLEELKELGSGTFGTVYHGKWRGTDVAIKRIKKSCFTGRSSEQERLTVEFWREADILSKLHHPNVVAFYGVVQDGPGGTLATVTEYMVNGSLRHVLLCKDRHLDRRKRIIIAMDAAFGMEYLHSKNIVHFDLKCDNLLVNLKDSARPICKVGDFGLSKIKRNTLVTGGVRGTLPWMAPELLNGSSNKVSEKVDVFSFGIVLWEILTGEEPYANMHYGAIIGGIVNNTLRPPVPHSCDPEWKLLMEQCWAPDPVARPSFTEIARRLRVLSTASQAKPPTNQVSR